jgi:hypothetical protein
MKHLKALGLTSILAIALLASPGGASAETLTSPAGKHIPVGTQVHFESVGHVPLHAPFLTIECNVTITKKTTTTGGIVLGLTTVVESVVEQIKFSNCTGGATVHALKGGTLKVASGGAVASTGAEFTVSALGFHCVYSTNNTALGTITGGEEAELDLSATLPRTGGSSGAFCGSTAPWTGRYKITKPKPLIAD